VYLHEVSFVKLLHRAASKGIQLSQWLLDLGALKVESSPLGELIQAGMSAVLVEGDIAAEGEGTRLANVYRERPDVCIVNRFLAPQELATFVRTCHDAWQSFFRLDGTALANAEASPGPDVLKIDVDNGGCDFLLAAIEYGLKPLIVQMELREYPAPLLFWQKFSRESACPYGNKCGELCQVTQDCSLASAMSILCDYELYPVMQGHDFLLLRADVAAAVIPEHLRTDPERFVQQLWCSMPHRVLHLGNMERIMQLDQRVLLESKFAVEERQQILQEYMSHHFSTERQFQWTRPELACAKPL